MILVVPKETKPGERRVALVPETVARLVKAGTSVRVQSGAGDEAGFVDDAYIKVGAAIAKDSAELLNGADLVVRVSRPSPDEIAKIPEGCIVIGFLAPLGDPQYVRCLAEHKLTAISIDAIPRITRAQGMDALSSQSNIAGYKAVLIGASTLPKFFPMLTTAAGTVAPARVLIIGAGVAGLQAIATARRLGAIVSAYDTRPVVQEQVKSLGAEFLQIDLREDGEGAGGYAKELSAAAAEKQRAQMVSFIAASDVVITTAQVPGRAAPRLITEEAVKAMRPGSVIVDLAAESGGNCELTEADKVVVKHGVSIVGTTNLPASVPQHASQLYSRNIFNLLGVLIKDGAIALNFDDEIVRESCLTHAGSILHKPTLAALAPASDASGGQPASAAPNGGTN